MYRDVPFSGPACGKHANAPATASCEGCEQPICDVCLVYDYARPHCFACAKKKRRGRRLRQAAMLAVVVGALGSLVGYVVTRPKRFDYGAYAGKVALLGDKVQAERCDRQSTLDLEEAMLAAGDARGALGDSDVFFAKCGDWYRLRWTRYSAHERLSEHALAVEEATKLIAHDPDDHDYRWWRGVAYEAMDRLDDAATDYRKALEITPALEAIPFNLARVLERQGRWCEAAQAVAQYLQYHPQAQTIEHIQEQLVRLTTRGRCVQDVPPN